MDKLLESRIDAAGLELLYRAGILGEDARERFEEQLVALVKASEVARVALDELGVVVGGFEWPEGVEGG